MTEKELEKLYNESYQSVYWTALSLLKNKEEAEDVTQDTFITAFNSYDGLRDKSKANAWIKKIAANKCLNILTRKRTFNADDEFFENTEAVPEDFLPESLVESDEKRKIIMDILEDVLSEDHRMTIILFYFNEMSTAEIAEQLGIPQGTVLSRLNYAKKKIRKGVEDYENKNNEKLFGMGVPFLTALFRKEAAQVPFRPMPASLLNLSASVKAPAAAGKEAVKKAASGAGKTAGSAAKAAAANGGKAIIMNKAVAAIAAVVLLGGGGLVLHHVLTEDNINEIESETSVSESSYISDADGSSPVETDSIDETTDVSETSASDAVELQTGAYTEYFYRTDASSSGSYLWRVQSYDAAGEQTSDILYDDDGSFYGWNIVDEDEQDNIKNRYFTNIDGTTYMSGVLTYENINGEDLLVRDDYYDEEGPTGGYETWEYDDQGRRSVRNFYSTSGELSHYYLYEYNDDGSYLRTDYEPDGTPTGSYTTCNSDGKIITEVRYEVRDDEVWVSQTDNSFDENGNVIHTDHYFNDELSSYNEYYYYQGIRTGYDSYTPEGELSFSIQIEYVYEE